MIGKLHIPIGFGDCVNGFKFDGVIPERDYVKKMVDDYNSHKGIIDYMMRTSFEHNMSINNFKKEKRKYKQQDVEFGELRCYIDNKDFNPMPIEELLEHFENNESFIVVLRVFNVKDLKNDPDISIDLKTWQRECVRIDSLKRLSTTEKFKALSKKDLKLSFGKETEMAAILKDCKMVNVYSNTKFALWVNKIIFIKNEEKNNK